MDTVNVSSRVRTIAYRMYRTPVQYSIHYLCNVNNTPSSDSWCCFSLTELSHCINWLWCRRTNGRKESDSIWVGRLYAFIRSHPDCICSNMAQIKALAASLESIVLHWTNFLKSLGLIWSNKTRVCRSYDVFGAGTPHDQKYFGWNHILSNFWSNSGMLFWKINCFFWNRISSGLYWFW